MSEEEARQFSGAIDNSFSDEIHKSDPIARAIQSAVAQREAAIIKWLEDAAAREVNEDWCNAFLWAARAVKRGDHLTPSIPSVEE